MLHIFIADYIASRKQAKLDVFEKEAAKRLAADASLATAIQLERHELEQKYAPANWLSDAASRAGQISLVSHAAKFTHSDSKSSSLFREPTDDEGYLSSASLPQLTADAVGNAAALDVAKLLQTEVEGDSLLASLQREDYSALAHFTQDEAQLAEWVAGFSKALITKDPASHKLSRQIYFPVEEGCYHLLSPLFASSFTHVMYQKLQAARFGEEVKAIREARKQKLWHSQPLVTFPNMAEMHFGGTKPQNISALNSARGGKALLLSCQPPEWQQVERAPKNISNMFARSGPFSRKAYPLIKLMGSLPARSQSVKNHHIRDAMNGYVESLIEQLFRISGGLQREAWRGWTLESPGLTRAQQLWLDPWRSLDDEVFRQEREQGDWQDVIAGDFARWLSHQLRQSLPDIGQAEKRIFQTHPLFRQHLREMEQVIAEVLK